MMNKSTNRKFESTKNNHQLAGFTIVEMIVAMAIFVLLTSLVLVNFRRGQKSDELRQATEEMISHIRHIQTLGMSGEIAKACEGSRWTCSEDSDCPLNICEGVDPIQYCLDSTDCPNAENCVEYLDPPDAECTQVVPPGGYGLAFLQTHDDASELDYYAHFYDLDGNQDYSNYCELQYIDDWGIPYDVKCFEYDNCQNYNPPDPGGPQYLGDCIIRNDGLLENVQYLPPKVAIDDVTLHDIFGACLITGCPVSVTFKPPKPTPYYFRMTDTYNIFEGQQEVRILLKHLDLPDEQKCQMIRINGVSGQVSSQSTDYIEWTDSCNHEI